MKKLVACEACGKSISPNATACPQYGEPTNRVSSSGVKLDGADGLANEVKEKVQEFRKAMIYVFAIALGVTILFLIVAYTRLYITG